jgi:hypothetical protein
MSNFGKRKGSKDTQAQKDQIRGGQFILPSSITTATIAKAYVIDAKSGARGLCVDFKLSSTGATLRQTEYFESGDAKGNKTYYEKDGVKIDLPGQQWVKDLILLTLKEGGVTTNGNGDNVAKDLYDLADDGGMEEREVPIYNFDKRAEVLTKVFVPVEMLGKKVELGVLDQYVDVPQRGSDNMIIYKEGKTIPSGKVKRENVIDKFFLEESQRTAAEILVNDDAEFVTRWKKAYEGKVLDVTANKIAPVTNGKFDPDKNSNAGSTSSNSDSASTEERGASTTTAGLFNKN